MAKFYIFDTQTKAENAQAWLHDRFLEMGISYSATKWYTPIQVPSDAPQHADKWLVKLPYELRDGVEPVRWRELKTRIINLPSYDPNDIVEITRQQFRTHILKVVDLP